MKRITPTHVTINLQSLRENYRALMKPLPREVRGLCVVKSNAYSHGAVPVALALQKEGASAFGVGTIDEGIELRKAGIRKPILILLGLVKNSFQDLLKYKLTPVLYDLAVAKELNVFLKKNKKMKVHLKVDTGMTRLGILPQEMDQFCRSLKSLVNLQVDGVMTHLADAVDKKFTEEQEKVFHEACSVAQKYFSISFFHLANSQATLDRRVGGSDSHWMVRLGIALYGSSNSQVSLKPVLQWKTKIVSLKKVPAGTWVSYGRTFIAQRESLIAVIPVGYADGYPRLLSNQGRVLVQGQFAPVVGRVCMDMTMIDVTDIEAAQINDEVVLIGAQGKNEIRAEELAEKAQTISYEIFCRISPRVTRVYK